MPHVATAFPARRPALALTMALAMLVAAPRLTHPGLAPPPGPETSLHALTGRLGQFDAAPATGTDTATTYDALRAAVSPSAVRLAVDKTARHPLDGPVAIHRTTRLGSLAAPLRLVSLASKEPAPEPQRLAQAPQPAAPPPPAVKTLSPRPSPPPVHAALAPAVPGKSILVAGDSLSLFLADALRPLLANRPQTAFASRGKVSSGLARPDFFNWEREMAALVAAHRPDTVIVMIATNDNQTLTRPDGSKVAFRRPGWDAEYARRVRRLVELARTANPDTRIHWIGAPVMGDPKLNADVAAINAVIAKELATLPGARFLDVSRTLADAAGHYAPAQQTPDGPRATRTKDGVHLTPYGAKLLASATLASLGPNLAALAKP
ncbi:SGNH/GDSL hydrolase family protein [Desulfovibrio sp. TomC]|uniref:SGNH/GDSL hydrolase family protein n=1 Tax=Desulfovibrio sp. TomC TaxID=1562888 RepID=UPI000574D26C|nr:DUF459 domain-containing protein [Desulfovibrio sp. TomC]KHK03744.1 hypothetical protein NY78_0800 [Desulfovibrio sp. TomC]